MAIAHSYMLSLASQTLHAHPGHFESLASETTQAPAYMYMYMYMQAQGLPALYNIPKRYCCKLNTHF